MTMPGTGIPPTMRIFCGTCGHGIDVHMTFKPADYFEPARRRCLTCEKVCMGPDDPTGEEIEEARRDASRVRERLSATFERVAEDEEGFGTEWRCKVCGGFVHNSVESSDHQERHG